MRFDGPILACSCDWNHISVHVCVLPSNVLRSFPDVSSSVIKSRLQAGSADAQRYKSALDGLLTVIREEGVEGLYKGIGSKLTQSVLTAAILFASQRRIYESIKKVNTSSFMIIYIFLVLLHYHTSQSHPFPRRPFSAIQPPIAVCLTSMIKYINYLIYHFAGCYDRGMSV